MRKPLNIVWFCTDQQRSDTLSCMGNTAIHTPHIDKLAREGVLFRRAYCQSPICTPSRASFLTGRYPCVTRMFFNGNDRFCQDEVLISKFLADNGYTCGLTGKLHLTAAKGRMEARGDDGYSFMKWSHHPYNDWPRGINAYQDWLADNGYDFEKEYAPDNPDAVSHADLKSAAGIREGIRPELHQTTWCVSEGIEFIRNQPKDKPWMLSINVFDPHPPLDPPREYLDRLKNEDMPLPLWKDGEMDNKPPHQQYDAVHGGQGGNAEPFPGMSDELKRERVRQYYAQIELIDDQVGRLVDYLDENGLRENTIVIFGSDHGEMNGDHGLYWKGAYFYEALVHVPLIISCPGTILQGVERNALMELVDITPTLLDLCGFEVPYYMQGKSFAPLLTDPNAEDHCRDSVYSEFYQCLWRAHRDINATMYFDGRYKIVCYHGHDYGELYDLETDPHEFDNLWGKPEYAQLQAELIKKNFDDAINKTRDFSMHRITPY